MSVIPAAGSLITGVELDGVALDLAGVLASVTLRHGVAAFGDGPTSSTATLTLRGAAMRTPAAGQTFRLETLAGTRFVGQLSDVAVGWEGEARTTLTASGNLASISRRKVGAGDWPVESWGDRVARVFAEADWPAELLVIEALAGGGFAVAARPGEESTVNAQLDALAITGPAVICDLPDGSILAQEIDARNALASGVVELDYPADLPPGAVGYAPEWYQALDVVNVAEVCYGADALNLVVSRNAASVTRYGERSTRVESTYATPDDASRRGLQIVTRQGVPRWQITTCAVLGLVTPRVGSSVRISELPAGSPMGAHWAPVVEGWVDTIEGAAWTTALVLSDPAASGLTLEWDETGALTWAEVDPDAQWQTAYTIESIEG